MMDLGLFEKNHIIPDRLLKLKNALLSIKPTSAESERVFSTGGKFLTPLRGRTSDKTIYILIFS